MKLGLFKITPVRGFTLIELMISMVIMGIMTVVLFANYPETVKRITLANLTHTVALTIHEAQVRGSAVDSINNSISGYGVYFAIVNPDKVILFGDSININGTLSPYQINVGDGLYQTTPDESKTITNFPSGYTVAKLCIGSGFPFVCNAENVSNPITSLTVSFTRPSPSPNIYINNATSTGNISAGCIELHSLLAPLAGYVRSIQVYSSGIIRTVNSGCE